MNRDVKLLRKIIEAYLGRDFLEIVDKNGTKVFEPGGMKITGHLLKFQIENIAEFAWRSEPPDLFAFLSKYSEIVGENLSSRKGLIYRLDLSVIYAYYYNSTDPDEIMEMLTGIFRQFDNLTVEFGLSELNLNLVASYHIGSVVYGTTGYKRRLQTAIVGAEFTILDKIAAVKSEKGAAIILTQAVYDLLRKTDDIPKAKTIRMVGYKDDIHVYIKSYQDV